MTGKVDYTSTELPDDLGAAFETALRRLRGEPPPVEEHIVGGARRTDGVGFERFDPCHPEVRVSAAHSAPTELVTEAVAVARNAFQGWRRTTIEKRCGSLLQAADRISTGVAELSAILSAETGKTRLEAIGEVQEAADIIKHYTHLMTENEGYQSPVVDARIAARLDEALGVASREGKVLTGRRLDLDGNWFSPIVVADLPTGHALTREELFGPFLTITAVDTFDDALAEANDVPYGLTAGVFSGQQAEVDQFVEQIEAGVIYVNRAAGATTGAWPGVQSFCGWKRSGSMGKGGLGHWYIQGFMREQSRTVAKTDS